jgi:deoxyribose-phosphate aldolase
MASTDDLDDLPGAARIALACLDLTSLNDSDTEASTAALCARALAAPAPVAALCVWPRFVATARAHGAGLRIAAVCNFPDGALDLEAALRDAASIVEAGGDEVDLVLPYHALLEGRAREAAALVRAVRRATEGHTLKLIIESGELQDMATVRAASVLGLDEGVDFLKTSTGKRPVSATPEAARCMLEVLAKHAHGAQAGFKASGGIRRVADALAYIALVREHLGQAALIPARFRFGASGLLDDIEAILSGGASGGSVSEPPTSAY